MGGIRRRGAAIGGLSCVLAACIARVDADPSRVLTNPNDPSQTIAVTPTTQQICGTICDALIDDYGVPRDLRDACIFECATGFEKAPDACYELVACVADRSLCSGADISPGCLARANDCLAQWSLANGSCRGCWQPSRTVHGKQIVTYVSEGTPSSDPRPEDFSGKTVAALLPKVGGDVYRFPGAGQADGTYAIPSVPGCGVWIQVGDTYTWASNADVDTSYVFAGRVSNSLGAAGTAYDLQVDNMVPWNPDDWLEAFIPQLGHYYGGFFGISGQPNDVTPGATSYLLQTPMDGQVLVDASQRDVMYVAQLATELRADGTLVRRAARAARIDNFTAVSGVTNAISATLADVPRTKTTRIDFRRSTFEAILSDLHPASKPGFNDATVDANPAVLDIWTHPGRSYDGGTAELALVSSPATSGDLPPFDLTYGSPYDASWGIDVDTDILFHVTLTNRKGEVFFAPEGVRAFVPLDRISGPVVARIGPPRNVRIDGKSAYAAQTGGLTPLIEWDAPNLGQPNRYEIVVHELVLGSQLGRRGKPVATFVIPSLDPGGSGAPALRSMRVPPGVLQAGSEYFFVLTAARVKTGDEREDSAYAATSEYRP